jgi:hypothetical protein
MDNRRRTLDDIISTIFLLNVGTVPTVWYIYISLYYIQGVENRNILLWFKCVLTAVHVNCIILFDKVL